MDHRFSNFLPHAVIAVLLVNPCVPFPGGAPKIDGKGGTVLLKRKRIIMDAGGYRYFLQSRAVRKDSAIHTLYTSSLKYRFFKRCTITKGAETNIFNACGKNEGCKRSTSVKSKLTNFLQALWKNYAFQALTVIKSTSSDFGQAIG